MAQALVAEIGVDMKPSGPACPPEPYILTNMLGVAVQYMPDPLAISAPYTGATCPLAQQAPTT